MSERMQIGHEGREEAADRRDARLRALFDDSPLGFVIVDRDGRFLETNSRFQELLGRSADELAGLSFADVTDPDDRDHSVRLFRELHEGSRELFTAEKRYARPDGREVHARTTVRRISGEGDAFALAVIEDVTDRTRAEREVDELNRQLRAREEQYRTLVMNVPGAIYRREIPPPYRFRFVSEAILDITGVPAGALMAHEVTLLDLVHPDDHASVEAVHAADLSVGESYVLEYRIRRPDGSVRWVHDKGRAIAGRMGADAALFDGLLFDVTQRRAAEERLREHEVRERARQQEREHLGQIEGLTRASVAVNSPLPLVEMLQVIADSARQVVGARQAVIVSHADDEVGAVVAESVDEPLVGRGHVAVPAEGSELHRRVCTAGETVRVAGTDLAPQTRPAQGERELPTEGLLAAPMTARDGRPLGILVLAEKREGTFGAADEVLVSQLAQTAAVAIETARLAELAAAREAARFRDELMAGMSHDMQTPLSAIVGTARMLRDDPDASREERGLLYEVLTRQSARLYTLVQQFLDHARLEVSRPLVVRTRPLDLRDALGYTQRLFHHQREIRLRLPDRLPQVLADPDRFQQILGNLLSNALKFSPGPVEVTVAAVGDGVEIDVVDDGVGMDAADLASLFGKFHRGANAEGTPGTGLGLYVSRAVARAMDGELSATSAPGRGSRFRLTLPLAPGRD